MRVYKTIPKDRLYFKQRSLMNSKGCWEWKLQRNHNGYGLMRTGSYAKGTRSTSLAHRKSYEAFNGEFDSKLSVLHKCDNPPCINPSHLFLGTRKDNYEDMRAKGRHYHKLTAAQVRAIRAEYKAGGSPTKIAKKYEITPSAVTNLHRRLSWASL